MVPPEPMTDDLRPRQTPGNVLLITADQWRADSWGGAGHPLVKTPALDRLAAEGATFTQHRTQTTPCGPARASLFTGLYAMTHRSVTNGTPLDDRFTNLARELRAGGYDPTLFGYTDTSPDPRRHAPGDPALRSYEGTLPGFSVGLDMTGSLAPWRAWLERHGYGRQSYPTVFLSRDRAHGDGRGVDAAPASYGAAHSDTAFVAETVIDWLRTRPRSTPWMAHVSFLRPHPPWIAPEPYNTLYDPADVPAPHRPLSVEDEAALHPLHAMLLARDAGSHYVEAGAPARSADFADHEVRQLRATYLALITEVDAWIGRIVDTLRELGQLEDTLVIVTSDHGEALGDRYRWGKRGVWESMVRVPLILRDPHAATTGRGVRIDRFTEAVDLLPTILDWCGLPIPDQADGRSLLPFLQSEPPADWRDVTVFEQDIRDLEAEGAATPGAMTLGLGPEDCAIAAIRDARWRYIHCAGLPPLLFDLQEDPDETRNLAADPAHIGTLADLRGRLLDWRMRHADKTLARLRLGPRGVTAWRGPTPPRALES